LNGRDPRARRGGPIVVASRLAPAVAGARPEHRRDEHERERCCGETTEKHHRGSCSRRIASLAGELDRFATVQSPHDPSSSAREASYRRPEHERSPLFSRRRFLTTSGLALAGATLYACTGSGRKMPVVTPSATASAIAQDTRWPIKRVIYVMLENRSFDNLFGRFPGADGATTGVKFGQEVRLGPCPAWLPGDLPHDRAAHLNAVNGGAYDGFGIGQFGDPWAYTAFERSAIPAYWQLARDHVLCDRFFASVGGPSFPNHFFFVAGQAGGAIDNPENIRTRVEDDGRRFKSWGCDAVGEDVFVLTKDDRGNLTKHDTCFDFRTVPEQLEEAGVSWAYYAADPYQPGYFWNALNGISGVFHTDLWRDERIRSVDRLIRDIETGRLPSVTWVTPRFELSDHPPESTCHAQNWVTDVVNALMRGDGWEHTAIFLTWDEWGGFYDHVVPRDVDDLGFGFRVPMLVVSPYARKGYVDDAEGEFSSPLRFVEDNWGLPYLTERIERTHNFEHVFAFERNPRRDARPLPRIEDCYGTPWGYPGDDYPGWPEGTEPDTTHFV
jgi:phospholipase C